MLSERYSRNIGTLGTAGQRLLFDKHVAVVGLGGLGGHIAEQFARLGVGKLTLIDGDRVSESDLNRQLFATEASLGQLKCEAAIRRLRAVNSSVEYSSHPVFLNNKNASELLGGADIVMDALDSAGARLTLEKACCDLEVPLVHGAVCGLMGEVAFVPPGEKILARLYGDHASGRVPDPCPSFVPPVIASVQVSQAVKYLTGESGLLTGRLLLIDLENLDFSIVEI